MEPDLKEAMFKNFYPRLTFVLIISILVLLSSGCRQKKEEKKPEAIRPVKTMIIKGNAKDQSYSFPGMVRAARRAIISFKVGGPLVALPVEEGQQVKKGDLIAQIQKRDFLNAVEEARARYREAEQQFRRYKELYAKKQVSRADFDRYRAARDVSKARLEDALNALKDTTLRASFDGVISKRYVENFQKVRAKDPIVNLQDISVIEILVNVPELFIAEIRDPSDNKIIARFESIPNRSFPLTIKEYSTEADPATQTYQVVFTMKQPDEANILPGMTATVITTTKKAGDESGQEILVPADAVLDAPGDHPYVWLFDQKTGTARKKEVKIGSLDGSSSIRILDGLTSGDILIIAGVTKLEDGQKVRLWEKQREGK